MSDSSVLTRKAEHSHKLSLLLYSGLLLTLLIDTLWLDPPQGSLAVITAIQVVPLLLPLWGLLNRKPRSAAWLCFILCFYFISGVLAAWFQPEQLPGWLLTIFSSSLFVVAMLFCRWQAQLLNLSND